ncbi:MAG: DUF3108 domain-containing protein [Gemmatimonadaceae bacterium]
MFHSGGWLGRLGGIVLATFLLLTRHPRLNAQTSLPKPTFAAGEHLEYSVSFGRLHVGSGSMSLDGLDSAGAHAMWHAVLTVSGGVPLFRVNDTISSWFDMGTFVSRRFLQRIHEGRYKANRDFIMDPSGPTYTKNGGPAVPSSADPLDDVSLIYFVRTLPLATGERYELPRYFQPEGNPVVIHVLRREQVTVPAGTFAAIVIQPEITSSGIFSQNGHAQLWFSDDSSRVLLQMKAGLSFGSINLYLKHVGAAVSVTPPVPGVRRH